MTFVRVFNRDVVGEIRELKKIRRYEFKDGQKRKCKALIRARSPKGFGEQGNMTPVLGNTLT